MIRRVLLVGRRPSLGYFPGLPSIRRLSRGGPISDESLPCPCYGALGVQHRRVENGTDTTCLES